LVNIILLTFYLGKDYKLISVNLTKIVLCLRQIPCSEIRKDDLKHYLNTNEGMIFLDMTIDNTDCYLLWDISNHDKKAGRVVIKVNNLKWLAFDCVYPGIINKLESSKKELIQVEYKLFVPNHVIKNVDDEPSEFEIPILIRVYSMKFIFLMKTIHEVMIFLYQNMSCLIENPKEVF